MKSIDEFRSEISIIELATANGYKLISSDGLKWPVLRNEVIGEKIIIVNPKNPANQGYWNVHDQADRGTLYHFVRNRLGSIFSYSSSKSEISNINGVLYSYLQLPAPERATYKYSHWNSFKNSIHPSQFIKPKELRPLDNAGYLISRGLSENTIFSGEFKSKIYNLKVGEYDNVAFPYYDYEGNMIGLEMRNKQFKQMLAGSNRSVGVWHSALPKSNIINQVVLTESPIDAISFFQLNGKAMSQHTLYVAFGGSIADGQIATIKKIVSFYKHSGELVFTSAVDNDEKGEEYHAKFLKSFDNYQVVRSLPVSKDFNEDLKKGKQNIQEKRLGIS